MYGALTLCKQVFKFAWRMKLLRDYPLAPIRMPKPKARPQPCFSTQHVEQLIAKTTDTDEKTAFALMAYAGLRIGEVEQLHWEDIRRNAGQLAIMHIRRGGSAGTTKDKDDRFVPMHPRIAESMPPAKHQGVIFTTIRERTLLKRLKALSTECGFENPQQWKLHSFRHYFASLCANHNVAYRKALAWLGHSSSAMLDLYYHLSDEDSQSAMLSLA